MDWQEILLFVVSLVLTALITWLAERIIAYINSKITDAKYAKHLTDAASIVMNAVKSTYQTYVEVLKNKNIFTAEAQREALTRTKSMVMAQLSQDLKIFIASNFGDLETWIQEAIESSLYDLKNKTSNAVTN